MNRAEIDLILQQGEGETIEYKGNFSSKSDNDPGKVMSAFANMQGGTIFLGIQDDGTVTGYPDPDEGARRLTGYARNCEPPLTPKLRMIEYEPGKVIVCATINKQPPVQYQKNFYKRIGSSCQRCGLDETRALFRARYLRILVKLTPLLLALCFPIIYFAKKGLPHTPPTLVATTGDIETLKQEIRDLRNQVRTALTVGQNQNIDIDPCANPPTYPAFNIFPITFENTYKECKDFPLLRMRKVIGEQLPKSDEEILAGVTASAGEEIFGSVYIDNGAAENIPRAKSLARDVRISTLISDEVSSLHTVEVLITAANAIGIRQVYKVNTGPNNKIEVVPNSGEQFDASGQLLQSGFSMGNNHIAIGDLHAGFKYSQFYRFRIKVI